MSTAQPSAVMMLNRILHDKDIVAVLDAKGFRAIPSSIGVSRPTAITMRGTEFTRALTQKTGLTISKILQAKDPDIIIKTAAQQLYQERVPTPPQSLGDYWGRVW